MYVYLYATFWKDDITNILFVHFRYNLITRKSSYIRCVQYVLAFEATSKARFLKLLLRFYFYSLYMRSTSYCIKFIIK